jgi:hypothetical protein
VYKDALTTLEYAPRSKIAKSLPSANRELPEQAMMGYNIALSRTIQEDTDQ